ncbi:hypothetical protein ABB37_07282 [Leptomonas pyrrhocoris]|uniref:GRIP domain-containing protein n=1 Tax=Leptomonas pyrrhocoris TaxID=157538 RepID=A0A0M9FVF3_LEPPY|nr:hypothetical protein ABB37_07282 [Leptomonas pyrrhocoris]KPA76890.1 hypothetical protein ABB37_07282 [Leptomonas pyrrhocoris]|eukprot:XP_015655329.1 hypothetical protein ABB37_07282 [Leptomonas pyrrhocoris]
MGSAQQRVGELTEEVAEVRADLNAKNASLEKLEESLVAWKDKVKAAKVGDTERIQALEKELGMLQSEAVDVFRSVAGFHGSTEPVQVVEKLPDDWVSTVNWYLIEVQTTVNAFCEESSVSVGESSVMASIEAMSSFLKQEKETMREAVAAKVQSEAEVASLKETVATLTTHCSEADARIASLKSEAANSSAQEERIREVEAENTELKTRCDLLRKELQRQREAVHRERAQQHDAAGAESPASTSAESASAVQSVLRAAAGGITDRDVASFVSSQGSQDGLVRSNKSKLEQLAKQNEELKRENAHNNSVIAQYIRELEGYKANERIQIGIEYLRNIVHQYLCAADDLRPKMIPAICTVLEFNNKQKSDVLAANPRCPRFH